MKGSGNPQAQSWLAAKSSGRVSLALFVSLIALGTAMPADASPPTDLETSCFASPTTTCLFKVAIASAQDVPERRRRDRMLAAIAQRAAAAAELDIASETAEIIRDHGYRDAAHSALAGGVAKAGRFDQALTTAARIRNTIWRDSAYMEVAIAAAKAKKVGTAQQTASLIASAGFREQTLGRVQDIVQNGGEDEAYARVSLPAEREAITLVQGAANAHAALEMAHNLTDPAVKIEALALIAETRAKAGDVETALRIAQEIDPEASCVGTCVERHDLPIRVTVGDSETALRIAREIAPHKSCVGVCDTRRDLTIADIAGIQAENGDRAGAFATVGILGDATRDIALVAIAESEMGDHKVMPTRAIETATAVQRPDLRAKVFTEIASELARRLEYCELMRHAAVYDPHGWSPKCP
jgi:hypothetical protein